MEHRANTSAALQGKTKPPRTEEHRNNLSKSITKTFATYKGMTKPLIEWSRELNFKYSVLHNRIYILGWSIKKAFTTPVRSSKRTK